MLLHHDQESKIGRESGTGVFEWRFSGDLIGRVIVPTAHQ